MLLPDSEEIIGFETTLDFCFFKASFTKKFKERTRIDIRILLMFVDFVMIR
jgi:hypothetical protein